MSEETCGSSSTNVRQQRRKRDCKKGGQIDDSEIEQKLDREMERFVNKDEKVQEQEAQLQ